MATDNLCHCKEPARWLLRVVPDGAVYGSNAWATCDEHIAEAARNLLSTSDMAGSHLELRREE